MMRSVLLALMFSGSVFALSANAYAQSSPDTRQTDQSEEDWRKSKKKGGTSSEDILDIIENTRSTGVGNGRGYSPIDALPEESRRHLMKERAKRMAQAGPNEPVDVSYKPSEAAKSDSDLQDDEKAAWEKMAQGMNGAPDQGLQGQGQQGQQGQSGQQGQGQQGGQQGQQQGGGSGSQGQQGQQGSGQSSDGSGQSGQSRSVMRGGSAASVSDIMARIKGLTPGQGQGGQGQGGQGQNGQGQSQQGQRSQGQQGSSSGFGQNQQGQGQQGQSQQGQSQQGQSQQGQSQQGQSQSQQQSQNQGQQQSQATTQSQQSGSPQSPAQSDAQNQAEAKAQAQAEAANKAHAISHAPASSQSSSSARTPEAISPLDRIKKVNREQNNSGSRSSASDYLKKKD